MARQRFTAEFQREAVRLLERGEKPVTQVAAELGYRSPAQAEREYLQGRSVS